MKTRIGKIARLPRIIREELNLRLENGETGGMILPWLNALPAVQVVLAAQFGASPVSQQNLSNWRVGGYLDWRQQQEHRDLVREVAQDAKEFAGQPGGAGIAGHLSTVLLAELAVSVRDVEREPVSPQARLDRLRELLHTVSEVRREDYHTNRLALDRKQKDFEAGEIFPGQAESRRNQPKQGETR